MNIIDTFISEPVLLSVRPCWVEEIASGKKTVEIRKGRPRQETPFQVFMYETQEKTDTPWMDEDGHMIFRGRGQVVGQFVCDRITEHDLPYPAYQGELDKELLAAACVDYWMLHRYVWSGGRFYGWHISELQMYKLSVNLSEIRKPCEHQLFCDGCGMFNNYHRRCGNAAMYFKRPPQSWCYVGRSL